MSKRHDVQLWLLLAYLTVVTFKAAGWLTIGTNLYLGMCALAVALTVAALSERISKRRKLSARLNRLKR